MKETIKKVGLVLLFISICLPNVIAQNTSTSSTSKLSSWLKNRIEVGGDVAFNIGNRTGIVGVSPTFGLRLTSKLQTSLSVICEYSWDNKYSTSEFSYGFGLSARYTIMANMYIHGQYTYNPYIIFNDMNGSRIRGVSSALWIGGGYTKQINSHITVYSGIIYDILAGPNADDNPKVTGGVSYKL